MDIVSKDEKDELVCDDDNELTWVAIASVPWIGELLAITIKTFCC